MEEKEVKIEMIKAASLALSFLKKNPATDTEQAMKHVMKNLKSDGEAKIAGMAAANYVLKLKEQSSRTTEKQIMQKLTDNTDKILKNIESQDKQSIGEMFK